MRSAILVLMACGTLSHASECQAADETTLLQGRSLVRLKAKKATDAKALLESLRHVATSLSEDSASTVSRDEVNEALEAASEALAELSPAIRQQVEAAQQQIIHASAAVDACHEGAEVRAGLQRSAVQYGVAVDTCEEDLETAIAAEQEACLRAEDCLCDEARTALSGQQALCASETETYEVAYCEHYVVCTMAQRCHESEVRVYNTIRADIESEIAALRLEYATVEQAACLTDLIQTAMTPPLTPITNAQMLACSAANVDVSAVAVNYPQLPAAPAACQGPTHGNPQCGVEPAAGSPAGCQCSFVPLQGEYSAGPVVRCDNCLEVRHVTEQNSCPNGWKIFSPRSQADWEVLHASLGDHAHHIADPARTPGFTTNWPASPWLIVDVSKGSAGRSPSAPLTMNSGSPDAAEWHTSDGSPFWLRGSQSHQPDGNYNANAFLDIFNVRPDSMGFDDHRNVPHSSSYLCQRKEHMYEHVHGGHCAGGHLGGNTHQADEDACSAHCRSTPHCRYFAFCDGGACDGNTNCALYNEAAGCPDDNHWGDYQAYRNL